MEVSIETSMNEPGSPKTPCQGTTPGSSMPNYSKEMELCTTQIQMLEPLFEGVPYIFWISEWWDMLLLNTSIQDLTQQTFGDQSLLDCINVKVPNQKSLSKGELLQLITFYTQQYFLLIVLFWKKTFMGNCRWVSCIIFMYSTTSNVSNSIKTIKVNLKHLWIHDRFFMSSRFLTCLFFIKKQLPTIMTKRVWTLPWGNVSQRTVTVIWHT